LKDVPAGLCSRRNMLPLNSRKDCSKAADQADSTVQRQAIFTGY